MVLCCKYLALTHSHIMDISNYKNNNIKAMSYQTPITIDLKAKRHILGQNPMPQHTKNHTQF